MPLFSFYRLLVGISALLLFLSCKNQPDTAKNAAADGHSRMVAMLDSIYKNADPRACYILNSRAAEMILQQMQAAPAQNQPSLKFNYAFQLLKAGKTEAATVHFSELIQQAGDQLNEQTKILYEMLALCYLRLGEQQNCIQTHTPESCVIPISGEGIYKMTSGPENAVKVYERILKAFPDDVQSRWLLNLAYMALGKWPDAVPKEYLVPASIFKSRSNIPRFREIAIPLGLDVRGTAGGVCMEDFDGDGNLDLFLTKWGLNEPTRFFHNNGDGTFSERTAEANLTGLVAGLNAIHADYDNDGDRDVFILRGAWMIGGTHPNSLLRNNGDGTFTDVTIEAGLLSFHPTQAADWADFDGDGWLDLFIGNETYTPQQPHPCELYHNNGDGTFTNLASKIGVDFIAFIKAVSWGDVNNDQRPDVYLSNLHGQNILLINRGGTSPETWKFEEMVHAGVGNPENSFPAFFFDYNNDGFDDIFATSFVPNQEDPSAAPLINELLGKQPEGDWLRLYRNNGDETFTDVHRALGLHTITYAMGHNFWDLDNDGWLDIFLGTGKPDLRALVPNRVFLNLQGKRFEDISMNGFSHIQKGHGVAVGDLDNDGDQDVYVVVGGALEGDVANNILYENPGNSNHWITLFLEGVTCNRDAIGAKIKVTVSDKGGARRQIWVTVGSGGSFGASSLRQEIGLGQAQKIESIEVQWPKPGVPNTVYTGVPLDKALKLKEGNSTPEAVPLKKISFGKGNE